MILAHKNVGLRRPSVAARQVPWRLPPMRVVEKEKDAIDNFLERPDDAGLKNLTTQLLESDPEMQEQLQKIQEAMLRVDMAKAAAVELEREYAEAAKNAAVLEKQEEMAKRNKAQELMADAEVAAAEKLLQAAELQVAIAQQEKQRWDAEINSAAGRVESGKAAVAAVIGGTAGVLPFMLLQGDAGLSALLSLLAAVASCGLFGVTYRYAVGSNPQNPHLKGGVVAAFGLVRAAAAADMLQLASAEGPFNIEVMGQAALYAGQSVLMFGFAAAAVEAGFQQGLIKKIDEPAS